MAVTRFISKNTPTQVNTTLLGVQIQLEPTPEPPVEAIEAFVFNTSGVKFNKKDTSVIQGKTEWIETWGEGEGPVVPGGATVWTDSSKPVVGDVVYTNQSDLSQDQGDVEAVYPQKFPDPPVEPECLSISLTYHYKTVYGTGYVAEEEDYQLYFAYVLHTYDEDGQPVEMEYEAVLKSTNDVNPIDIDGTYYYLFTRYDGDSEVTNVDFYCTSQNPQPDDTLYTIGTDEFGNHFIDSEWGGYIAAELSDVEVKTYTKMEGKWSYAEGLPPYGDNQARPEYIYKVEDYFGNDIANWVIRYRWAVPDGGEGRWWIDSISSLYDITGLYGDTVTFAKTNDTAHYPGKVEWKYDSGDGDELYVWTDDDTPQVNDGAIYNPAEPLAAIFTITEVEYTEPDEPDEPDPVDPYEPPAPDEPNCVVSYSITGEDDTWTEVDTTLTDLNNVIANIPRYIYLKFSQDVIITEE